METREEMREKYNVLNNARANHAMHNPGHLVHIGINFVECKTCQKHALCVFNSDDDEPRLLLTGAVVWRRIQAEEF